LNGILGMIHLLLDTKLANEQYDMANTARTCGDQLLMILCDILDFSKVEAGKLTLETLDFDLREVIENVVDLLAERARVKGLELASLVPQELPTRLRGDPGRSGSGRALGGGGPHRAALAGLGAGHALRRGALGVALAQAEVGPGRDGAVVGGGAGRGQAA
jgi:hypothetical protein